MTEGFLCTIGVVLALLVVALILGTIAFILIYKLVVAILNVIAVMINNKKGGQ